MRGKLLAITASLSLVASVSLAQGNIFFVHADILKIRSKPSIESAVLGYYGISRTDTALQREGDWIQTPKGYVHKDYVTFFQKVKVLGTEGVISASSLAIRANPGTSGVLMGGYKQDERIVAIALYENEKGSQWIKTDMGFVSAKYVQLDESMKILPQETSQPDTIQDQTKKKESEKSTADIEALPPQRPQQVIAEPLIVKSNQRLQIKKPPQKTKVELTSASQKKELKTEERKVKQKSSATVKEKDPKRETNKKQNIQETSNMLTHFQLYSTKLFVGIYHSNIDKDGNIDTKTLSKNALSIGGEFYFKTKDLKGIQPLIGLEYVSFSDRDLYKGYLGARKDYTTTKKYSYFTTGAIGYGSLYWKKDPIELVSSKKVNVTSPFLQLEGGVEFTNGLELSLGYVAIDLESELSTQSKKGSLKESGLLFFRGGYRFEN